MQFLHQKERKNTEQAPEERIAHIQINGLEVEGELHGFLLVLIIIIFISFILLVLLPVSLLSINLYLNDSPEHC
jgi:hypothetical protein